MGGWGCIKFGPVFSFCPIKTFLNPAKLFNLSRVFKWCALSSQSVCWPRHEASPLASSARTHLGGILWQLALSLLILTFGRTSNLPCENGALSGPPQSARPNPKIRAPENPLFIGFSVLRGGLRPWSPWGGDRSGDCEFKEVVASDLEGVLLATLQPRVVFPSTNKFV